MSGRADAELCFNNVLPLCALHALNLELNEKVDTFFLDLSHFSGFRLKSARVYTS
jgi:hypothetical protein